jgi:hypothetical protein
MKTKEQEITMEVVKDETGAKMSEEQMVANKKAELLTEIAQMRHHEKIQCLKEIESVCAKYQFRLDAELVINSQGNHTNVFLVDMTK